MSPNIVGNITIDTGNKNQQHQTTTLKRNRINPLEFFTMDLPKSQNNENKQFPMDKKTNQCSNYEMGIYG